MAWIRTAPESSADPELTELYDRVRDPRTGQLDHILQIHSLDPKGLRAHRALYLSAMQGTEGLPRVDREMIAVVVSAINACHY